MSLVNEVAAGAVGGLAGGMVMSAAMMAGKKTGIVETPLPVRVEHKVAERAGVAEPSEPTQQMALAQGGHLLFSAALGAGYGLLRAALSLPVLPSGPLYGLGLYALNLGGIGPAFGITGGPWNEPPMAVGRRIMMHAVYGTVTAAVAEQVRQRMRAGMRRGQR